MNEKKYEDVEAEFWEPKNKGDEITGVFVSLQERVGKNKSNVYNIETPTGKIKSVWGSTVLDNKMQLIKARDDIKIIFLGEVDGKDREYKDFKIQRAKVLTE